MSDAQFPTAGDRGSSRLRTDDSYDVYVIDDTDGSTFLRTFTYAASAYAYASSCFRFKTQRVEVYRVTRELVLISPVMHGAHTP
jgi:hypothetical protein